MTARRSTFRDTDRGFNRIAQAIRGLRPTTLRVGVLEPEGGAEADADGATLAGIAAINEYGSADGHVPERSFLRSTFDAHQTEYGRELAQVIEDAALSGADPEQGLARLGLRIVGDVQEAIASGVGPANAPSTVARKGSSKPLIDTGRLRQSIRSEVVPGGGGE
jgi:hypothetical protein